MSKIMKEIAKVTGEGSKDQDESAQAYRGRLLASIRQLNDDEWGNLSPDAQEWSNEATKAENDDQDLPDFPDVIKKQEAEEGAPSSKTHSAKNGKTKPMTTKKKNNIEVPVKKSVGGTSAKKAKASVPKKSRKLGAQDFIRLEVLNDINVSSDDLKLKLKKKGYKVSSHTVNSLRSSFRQGVKLMQEQGYLKKRFDF